MTIKIWNGPGVLVVGKHIVEVGKEVPAGLSSDALKNLTEKGRITDQPKSDEQEAAEKPPTESVDQSKSDHQKLAKKPKR